MVPTDLEGRRVVVRATHGALERGDFEGIERRSLNRRADLRDAIRTDCA
ncbi:hypothetical protein [Candidatus Burkholderia verschuerenii]|nr:hypothetical protein [Candidatus Burkholderia verschuerenii]